MKRILSALLSFCIIITGISCGVFAYETDDTYDEGFEFLKYLKITTDTDNLDKKLTRADFAVYTGNILGIDNYIPNEKRYFADVPMDHWALNSINILTEMNVISGDGTGNFRPFDEITQGEAVKMLLSLIGYGLYGEMRGGYPMGYVAVARETKLASDVEWEQPLTKGLALEWIYEALHINVMEPEVFGGDEYKFKVSEDETLLSLYRDTEMVEGVLSSVGEISVDENPAGEDCVIIDGERYSYSGVNPVPYLGMIVRAYFKEDRSTAQDSIFYVWKLNRENKVLTIDASDFISFDENSYRVSYYENEKSVTASISRGVGIVKNLGYEAGNVVEAMKSFKKGSLTFIDNNRDNVYDYILIMDYRNIVVSAVDTARYAIYDKYNRAQKTELDLQSGKVSIYNPDKTDAEFGNVKPGSVLTVYENGEYMSINICDKSISGTICEIGEKNGKTRVKVGQDRENAQWYTVDEDFITATSYIFKTGAGITALLDAFGNIAEITDGTASDMSYGILVGYSEDVGLNKKIKLKIFTRDSKMDVSECAAKVKIDGEAVDNTTEFEAALEKGKSGIIGQLIRYKKNSEGKISAIDTCLYNEAGGESEISLHKTNSGVTTYFQEETGQFGTKILSGGSTVYFAIPSDEELAAADDNDYYTLKQSYFRQSENYTVDTYKTDVKSGYEDVLVIRVSADKATTVGEMLLVTGFMTLLDEEEDVVDVIEGYSNGVKYSYIIDDDNKLVGKGIAEGDIVRLHTNSKGKVADAEIIYDYSAGGVPAWAPFTSEYTWDKDRIVYGNVISVRDNVLKLGYNSLTEPDEVAPLGSVSSILVYDSEARDDEKVYIGTVADLYDAESAGADCSKVFIRTKYQKLLWMIVYK